MATEKQITANRANALKSTGPRTPDGKLISSLNSLRHGMLAKSLLIRGESLDRFRALLATFYLHFQPRNAVENGLVDSLAAARWRQMRYTSVDSAGINLEIDRLSPADAAFDGPTRAHLAICALSVKPGYTQSMRRYVIHNDRQVDALYQTLCRLRTPAAFSDSSESPKINKQLAPPGYLELPQADFSCGFLPSSDDEAFPENAGQENDPFVEAKPISTALESLEKSQ